MDVGDILSGEVQHEALETVPIWRYGDELKVWSRKAACRYYKIEEQIHSKFLKTSERVVRKERIRP